MARLLLGGNLPRVIRSVYHPVLVDSPAFVPIERFLIAYDGSPSVEKAVEFVLHRADAEKDALKRANFPADFPSQPRPQG